MVSARILTQWFAGLSALTRNARLDVTLTPTLPSAFSNGSLSLQLVIESPNIAANGLLLSLTTLIGNVPSTDYDEQALIITDTQGPLPFVIRDSQTSPPERLWLPARDTEGDVTISFTAYPRHVDANTPIGPRVDLRENFGGLIGSGFSFIPLPPTAITYDIHLNWNLSLAPEGTQAVWTFGEGIQSNIIAPAQALARSVYAVGPIRSVTDQKFGLYWFGSPPFNVTSLAFAVEALFGHMAPFFNDSQSTYRVFIRHSPRGYGGTAFEQSFILEYDDQTSQHVSHKMLFDVLAHEMVHNWLTLELTPGMNTELLAWYAEGM